MIYSCSCCGYFFFFVFHRNKLKLFTWRQTTSASDLMLKFQDGHNELESVRDTVSLRYKVCFNSTTLKITTFVINGVW